MAAWSGIARRLDLGMGQLISCVLERKCVGLALTTLMGLVIYVVVVILLPRPAAGQALNCGDPAPPPPVGSDVFTLTGIVSDTNRSPVACVRVFAFNTAFQSFTYTGNDGRFSLTLRQGTYDVVFIPPSDADLGSHAYRGIGEAKELHIILNPGHKISGTIYRDEAKTIVVANVAIYVFNKNSRSGFGLPPSQSDGTYAITLDAGDWEITFTPPALIGLGPTSKDIAQLDSDQTIDVILPPGFTVTGRVTATQSMGGEIGIAGVELYANDPETRGYGFAPTDASGFYTGTLPLGTFDLLLNAPPFRGLGSTVITGISGPSSIQRDVTLPPGHTVSGTARCNVNLPNVFVLAHPLPPLSVGSLPGWGRYTGIDGKFALALQPGTYTFVASLPSKNGQSFQATRTIVMDRDQILYFDLCPVYLSLIRR
jgi:hypothetical protein